MGLGFGLLTAQMRPGERSWDRAYTDTIDLAVAAERLGLQSIWTSEHHFVDDGYMPSLLVVSAAIAQATHEIEIGTGVLLAPLIHPLRLAEDAATVSLLSGGRFTLGLGIGWSQTEFDAFGADRRVRGKAMEELLRILPVAWSGDVLSHHGDVYDLAEVAVRPTPTKRIPILIGGSAEAAVRRAARLADGVYANAPAPVFLEQLEWIRDEMERTGRDPATFRIVYYSVMMPGASQADADALATEHVWPMMWKYSDMEPSAVRPGGPPEPPPFDVSRRDSLYRRGTAIGTTETIVGEMLAVREKAGVDIEFVARSFFSTMDLPQQLDLMTQLAEEVAPHL